jgi:hypothetical protein
MSPSLRNVLVAIVALAAVVVILVVTGVIGGDDDSDKSASATPDGQQIAEEVANGRVLAGPKQAPFAMRHTDHWELLSAQQLQASDPPPLAGLRRKDRSAVLTVSVRGPVRGGISSLAERLPDELKQRFADFRLQSSRRIQVAGGPALYTSWIRTESGRVQSNLVVPVSNQRSFSVDVVLNPGAKDAAVETGLMLRTFDTAPAQ